MISDAEARAAALRADRSFIVQAPAGSGKTGLLVYRMLTLLAVADSPQQVLAITFTRKATSEMLDRLLQLLALAENDQSSDDFYQQQGIDLAHAVLLRDRQLNWNLLDSPHQLQILTIDSFSARLAASMPWLSRLGDRPHTTDHAEPHYAAAVEQLLRELLVEDSELATALQSVMLEMDFNYNKARRLFSAMLSKRDQWLRHLLQTQVGALRSSLEHAWQTIANEHLSELVKLCSEPMLQRLIKLAQQAAQKVEVKGQEPSLLAAFENFDRSPRFLGLEQWQSLRHLLLTGSGTYRKRIDKTIGIHSKTDERTEFLALLEDLRDDDAFRLALLETDYIPELRFSEYDWKQLMALETVLKSLAALLQLRFRAVGECDHSEVTQRANFALQELDKPTDLGLRLDYQLRHILVDEFQDTSHGQIELLRRLTAGWSSDDQGTGQTLFLVGDPMQSIYRFREADVSLFLRVAENTNTRVFDNIDIQYLSLSENFRSSQGLVDWFNATFKSSFPARNNVLTGAIQYAKASSNKTIEQSATVLRLAQDKEQQAQILVSEIKEALLELTSPQARIAVLVRSRSQLVSLLPAIQAAGIAYIGVDIQSLKNQQAVVDVLALVKALCREDDRVSWLALLRGPWCGLSLHELKQWLPRHDITIWQQLENLDLSQQTDSEQRLQRVINIMRAAINQRQQVGLSELVRWTWQSLGGEQSLFGTSLDDIDTVFNLLEDLQRGGDIGSVNELEKALDGLYAQPVQQADTKVIISTIHKAKGLQYDTVILPSLASPPRASSKDILMWAEHQNAQGSSQLLLAPMRLNSQDKASHYNYLRELDKKRAANETIRLMYVACTRAQRKLVLIGQAAFNEETGEHKLKNKSSLLATIWQASVDQFDPAPNVVDTQEQQQTRLAQDLQRLGASFVRPSEPLVQWQSAAQLNTQQDQNEIENDIEYQWATEVATAVGIVLHDWLQYVGERVLNLTVDQNLQRRWRTELVALRVPADRVDHAVKRLIKAVTTIQNDQSAHFLFIKRQEQDNEYTLAAFEKGVVNRYRIDRTFVDEHDVRWVLDYKSTDTMNQNIDEFVDEQVATRHKTQLDKYGALMSQLDQRPIKLAVYFPLLGKLRSWDYSVNEDS